MHEPVGGRRLALLGNEFAAVKTIAKDPEAEALLRPRCGNNRVSASGRSLLHHSMAMRSGPSTRTTAWVAPPPRELCGGPSGTVRKRHLDRFRPLEQPQRPQWRFALDPLRPRRRLSRRQTMLRRRRHAQRVPEYGCPAAGARPRARPPIRAAMRSIRAANSSLSCTLASRSRCCCTTISTRLADRRMRSKPKPGSSGSFSASSRSRNSRSITSGLVTGCPVSTAIARTAPSVRKKWASSRRAPLPCRSIASTSIAAKPGQRRRDHGFGGDRFGKAFFDDIIRQRF